MTRYLLFALPLLAAASHATCLISGTVTDTTTSKQLPKSRVYAKPQKNNKPAILHLSDTDGKFCFERLESGIYQVVVERSGYLPTVYGGKPGAGEGMPLALDGSAALPPLTVRLVRTGAISGIVLDATGEPQENVRVQLNRKVWDKGWLADEVNTASTDDRGAFRFALLPPGTYYVGVNVAVPERVFLDAHGQPNRATATTTYYNGALSFARATPILIEPGREVENLVMAIERVTPRHLSGRLAPSVHVEGLRRISVTPEEGYSIDLSMQPDGSFSGDNLFPVKYRISAIGTAGSVAAQVDLTSGDVDGFIFAAEPLFNLPFTVRVEGPTPESSVQLVARNLSDNSDRASSIDHGEYRFAAIQSGTFVVYAYKYFVKAVLVGGQPKNPQALELRGGQPGTIEILLSPNAARVEGHLDGSTSLATTVILVNETLSRVAVSSDMVLADHTGAFQFESLSPGKYRLLAIEGFDDAPWGSPELLAALAAKSIPLDLKQTDNQSVKLPVITQTEWTAALRKIGM